MTGLADIPALRGLAPAVLEQLDRACPTVRHRSGAVLRPVGAPARFAVLLVAGAVVARHTGPSGAELWSARWEAPAIVDKPTLLSGGPATADLVTPRGCTVRLLPRDTFLALLDQHEPVRQHVLGHLARDVLVNRERLAATTTRPAVARVAATLLDTANRAGDPTWRGSQEELARAAGLTRVTVNRALHRLSRAGVVRVSARCVTVVDAENLARYASGTC
ncbi:Crp/Fnr family transcriptional regulator [Micromonospora sp. NPDC126480]|uniref:Crp/Fnr family transcriptional regulator n=1 Tax=Micromonospora sp. NPDC126480 TaxID=3155312 RepID=UPI003328E51A